MVHDYPPLSGGGLALSVLTLAEMASSYASVDILSSRDRDHFADDSGVDLSEGVEYAHGVRVRLVRPFDLLGSCRRADHVIVHWTFSFRPLSTLALLLAPMLGRVTVCVVHTAPRHCEFNWLRHFPGWARHLLLRLLQRALLPRCSAVVALSRSHAEALTGIGIAVSHVLPVPLINPHPGRTSSWRAHSLDSIGVAGELSRLKGAESLPSIIRELADTYRFHVAGAGPLGRNMQNAVQEMEGKGQSQVTLWGRIPPCEMDAFYDSVDCLLVTSFTESQCRVAIEAMLRGVIVLARRSEGVVDLIVDGVTGFFIDPTDVASVRQCLDHLRDNPSIAEAVRDRAYREAATLVETAKADWLHFLAALPRGRGAGSERPS